MSEHHNPIRILHIVTNMSYGGLENLLMNYYRHIDRTKIQFDFLTHFSGSQDFEAEINSLGGRLYKLPQLNPFSLSYKKQLSKFFAQHPEYQVVHSHLDCMAGIPLKYAKKHGVPVRIAHSHNSNQTRNAKYILKLFYKRLIPAYATDLFACGEEAGNWMFGKHSYTIMSNAIDAKAFTYNSQKAIAAKQELNIAGKYILGHVGQFREQKNHLFLIEILCEALKINANCCLLLIGKGPQQELVREAAKKRGLEEHIVFLGARADIPELMQAMDVFLLPSFYEGFPVTMVEAQAAGLPCVISSGVPIECKLTEHVQQVALADGAAAWAAVALQHKTTERIDTYPSIQAAGYDITTNAQWLTDFYLSKHEKRN